MKKKKQNKIFPLMVESVDYMKLSPSKREFAHAVLRAAIEYAAMRQAGFIRADKPRVSR